MGKRKTLVQKMKAMLVFVILLPACAYSLLYYLMSNERQQESLRDESFAILNAIGESILDKATMVETSAETLAMNDRVQSLLMDRGMSLYDRIIRINYDISETIREIKTVLFSLGVEMMVLTPQDDSVQSYPLFLKIESFREAEEYDRYLSANANRVWVGKTSLYPQTVIDSNSWNRSVFCYYRNVFSLTGKTIGIVRCAVSIDKLFSSIDNFQNIGSVYIIQDDRVICATGEAAQIDPASVAAGQATDADHGVFFTKKLDRLGVSIALRIERNGMLAETFMAVLPQIALAVVGGLLLILLMHCFLTPIQKRMEQAVAMANEVADGRMDIAFPDPDDTEIGQLIKTVNLLLERLGKEAEYRITYEQSEKESMRLALQYQVNPHFLFNVLNWIQLEMEMGTDKLILSEAITLLGKLLRYNLNGQALSTLAEEKQQAAMYVRLMNMRKKDMIALWIDTETLPEELRVIRFLFQPICENAIQHGGTRGQQLHIWIRGYRENGSVFFEIANDGMRIPERRLQELNAIGESPRKEGVGLANVYARLKLLYGEAAGLEVASSKERTCVKIHFPIEYGSERRFEHETADRG